MGGEDDLGDLGVEGLGFGGDDGAVEGHGGDV
jgi:hypothetical protein